MELTRRDMLKMSLLGSAALAFPLERVARTQLTVANRLPEDQIPAPFQAPFVVPPVARPVHKDATTDYYEMTMKQGYPEIIPGLKTEVWGYEGLTPGPTIVAQRGRKVVVRHKNQISNPAHKHTSVHLHGNASLPQYDGYANDTTAPGEFKDYHYPNEQDARTLWYHDHGVHATAQNAYMGCAAFYISHDELEQSLPIPKGKYDVPLVIRDAVLATNGQLIFDQTERSSLFGDIILTNGVPWPVMKVERRKYRFRVLNGSISRGFNLALSTNHSFHVIGHDGGLAPAPVQVNNLRVGMAERYEIVIDFARYNVGDRIVLQNRGVENVVDYPSTNKVMRFDVVSDATDISNNEVPAQLNPDNEVMKLQASQAVRTRHFEFGRSCIGGTEDAAGVCVGGTDMWTINDKIWDPNRVDANPAPGTVEIWEFTNKSGGWNHPIHAHLVDFKILSRNGGPAHPWENGPKDTAYVAEGETVRVIMKFDPEKKGKYMIHCHNLIHEDHDMMAQFQVGTDGPAWSSAPAKPISEAGPLWESTPPEPTAPVNNAPVISILRPRNAAMTKDRTPTIIAMVKDSPAKLAKANIKLYIDGRAKSVFSYSPTSGNLTYTCKWLRLGWHSVKIVATDAQGRSTVKTWKFRVVS